MSITTSLESGPVGFKIIGWLTLDLAENGEFIIVLDSTDRENEGDLIIAAEDISSEKMSFMIRYTR